MARPATPFRRLALGLIAMLAVAACAAEATTSTEDPSPPGVREVSAADGALIQADPPPGLVVLDVRTPEEFAEGHLPDAVMVDFYEADFADRLAELDKDTPYLLYCRSGNRSGQTAALMNQLGFTDVAEVGGGIQAWAEADLPITVG